MSAYDLDKAAGVIAGLLDQRPMLDAAPSVIRDIQAKKIAQALASQGLLLPEGFVADQPDARCDRCGHRHMEHDLVDRQYVCIGVRGSYRAQAQEKQG